MLKQINKNKNKHTATKNTFNNTPLTQIKQDTFARSYRRKLDSATALFHLEKK